MSKNSHRHWGLLWSLPPQAPPFPSGTWMDLATTCHFSILSSTIYFASFSPLPALLFPKHMLVTLLFQLCVLPVISFMSRRAHTHTIWRLWNIIICTNKSRFLTYTSDMSTIHIPNQEDFDKPGNRKYTEYYPNIWFEELKYFPVCYPLGLVN